MQSNENLLSSDLKVDDISMLHLKETARWAKFLAITGFIVSILIALLGIFINYFLSIIFRMNRMPMPATGTGGIGMVYIFFGIVYFVLSFYFYRFGVKMITALRENDQAFFNESLLNQKRTYRMLGIIMIIYLGILALGLLGILLLTGLKK